jgi:hypothetical protein
MDHIEIAQTRLTEIETQYNLGVQLVTETDFEGVASYGNDTNDITITVDEAVIREMFESVGYDDIECIEDFISMIIDHEYAHAITMHESLDVMTHGVEWVTNYTKLTNGEMNTDAASHYWYYGLTLTILHNWINKVVYIREGDIDSASSSMIDGIATVKMNPAPGTNLNVFIENALIDLMAPGLTATYEMDANDILYQDQWVELREHIKQQLNTEVVA